MVSQRRLLACATISATVLASGAASTAHADTSFPDQTINIVVPFAAGGGHDFVARLLASRLGPVLDQTVVVLNRGGANGTIGAAYVASAPPDGYTVLMGSPAETVISPFLISEMSYDPDADLTPVTLAGVSPIALIAHPSVPVESVSELIEYSKANPGTLDYGTPGVGSAHHLAVEWIARTTGLDANDVPYKGAGPATADTMSGHIPLASVGMAPVMPMWKAGNVNVLAIMNKERLSWLPDVPTASEAPGAEDVDLVQWMGVFAPAGTPEAVVQTLNEAFVEVLNEPEVRKTMIEQGVEPVGNSVTEFTDFLAVERVKFGDLVQQSGITPN